MLPGNEGRSYVLRRILRKAIRHGRMLGIERAFLPDVAEIVIEQFGAEYPELADRRSQILKVLRYEEASFSKTLTSGVNRLQALTADLHERGERIVPGVEPSDEAVGLIRRERDE